MSEKCELLFEPVDLESLDRIRPYTSAYGEDSFQHSPVSMFALQDKYGDSCCILDGFLYVLRSRLCDEKYRVYLAPLGEGDRTAAYARILDDAGSCRLAGPKRLQHERRLMPCPSTHISVQ